MKKKILVLSLIVVCLLSAILLVSCGGGGGGDDGRPSYTVTFDPAGGSFSGELTIQVKEGDKIPEPPVPTYDGRIFTGWYSGKSSSSKWDFETGVVSADVTLKAWYSGGVGCAHTDTYLNTDKSYEATCDKSGRNYYKCSKCGYDLPYENIPALGHDLQEERIPVTCAQDGYLHTFCVRDNCTYSKKTEKKPATGQHIWSDGYQTIIAPTMYVGGKEAKECTVCGKQQVFPIPALAELEEEFWNMDIGNYTYTGGKYVNASFVDIAPYAGISATSYYTICYALNAIDGGVGSFWCADTLVEGAKFTGDQITLSFDNSYDIGMIKVVVPHYSAWDLGDDCYVSYDLEALINGEWQVIDELNDKNATSSGTNASIIYEFDTPVNTSSLRLVVTNSSRYTPAMIYEIEVMAAVDETVRVAADLINSATLSSSGKYNSWASGTEALTDGVYTTGWYTNYREKEDKIIDEVFATISFPESKFVTAVQFVVAPDCNKEFSIHYKDENDDWVRLADYKLSVAGGRVTITGDSNNDNIPDGVLVEIDGNDRVIFTTDIAKFTKEVKLVIEKDVKWQSYVYEFTPYTAIEQASGIPPFSGCSHGSFKELTPVPATCTEAGYTPMECRSCGFKTSSDATDALGHVWGKYEIATVAEGTSAGTKTSKCSVCDAARTTNYYNDYEDSTITTYFHNAPAAWAQTLDDGNYLSTYEWLIPKLQHYGWKATAVLSVCYVESLVPVWQEYFATGVLDLGSHSYTHGGYYSGIISENSLLGDVHNAHYWFMSKFAGQRILGFATPNGQTSTGTSEYVTSIMASARNGGNSAHFYNLITDFELVGDKIPIWETDKDGNILLDENGNKVQKRNALGELMWETERRVFGNMNSYISKADQTEGPYVLVSNDNKTPESYKIITTKPVIDEETGEQAVDEDGNLLWENLETPEYELVQAGGYILNNNSYTWVDKEETHILIKAPNNTYHYVAKEELANNYVFDSETERLQLKERGEGTYKYVETRDADGKMTDSYYEWVEVGSYDYSNGSYVFREDNNGAYKLNHVALGSYEKGINEILEVGGMTVECLHEIGQSGSIYSTYCSTNSKFSYLDKTGIWVCSYTELIQYVREQLYATVTTNERTDTSVSLTVTDTLDDIMFNAALTIKVDIDDSWTEVTATQNGEAVNVYIENGFAYVDAVPDRGEVVISLVNG